IQTTSNCMISGGTSMTGRAPRLGPLANNDGPTVTHVLLSDSPAIDSGSPATPGSGGAACELSDQRRIPRPPDGSNDGSAICDIGAVEVAFPPLENLSDLRGSLFTFESIPSTFMTTSDTSGCPSTGSFMAGGLGITAPFTGKFSFSARLRNISNSFL